MKHCSQSTKLFDILKFFIFNPKFLIVSVFTIKAPLLFRSIYTNESLAGLFQLS